MPATGPGIVDSHVHLLPGKLAQKVRLFFEERISSALVFPLDHATVLEMLAAQGIDTVWSLPYAHKEGVAGWMNQASAQTAANNSNANIQVIGGATVHPRDTRPAEILREAFEELGLRVLKLHCSVGNFTPDDPALDPVWELVERKRVPVVVHCGRAVSGHSAPADLSGLETVGRRYPAARLIIAHCAHPYGSQALDLVDKYPSVYADLTPVVSELVALPAERVRSSAHKLLFGTDAPNTARTVSECLAHVESFGLSAEVRTALLGGNARRLVDEVEL